MDCLKNFCMSFQRSKNLKGDDSEPICHASDTCEANLLTHCSPESYGSIANSSHNSSKTLTSDSRYSNGSLACDCQNSKAYQTSSNLQESNEIQAPTSQESCGSQTSILSKGRSPGKAKKTVRFGDSVQELCFDRTIMFDRLPGDFPFYPLGMNHHACGVNQLPLPAEDKVTNRETLYVTYKQRREMLQPQLAASSNTQKEEIRTLHSENLDIFESRLQIGCNCKGGACKMDSCQCKMSGVSCCKRKSSSGRRKSSSDRKGCDCACSVRRSKKVCSTNNPATPPIVDDTELLFDARECVVGEASAVS